MDRIVRLRGADGAPSLHKPSWLTRGGLNLLVRPRAKLAQPGWPVLQTPRIQAGQERLRDDVSDFRGGFGFFDAPLPR